MVVLAFEMAMCVLQRRIWHGARSSRAEIQILAAHRVRLRSSVVVTDEARDPRGAPEKGHSGHCPKEASVAEYIAKLRDSRLAGDVPTVTVVTVTEFEAAALALEEFRQRGVAFDGETGLEMLEGNVTASKPVPVKDILYWLRNRPEGQALVHRDRLQPLLEYVKQ